MTDQLTNMENATSDYVQPAISLVVLFLQLSLAIDDSDDAELISSLTLKIFLYAITQRSWLQYILEKLDNYLNIYLAKNVCTKKNVSTNKLGKPTSYSDNLYHN